MSKSYITVQSSMFGYFAALFVYNEEDEIFEPWETSDVFKTKKQAEVWAQSWAAAEEIEYV